MNRNGKKVARKCKGKQNKEAKKLYFCRVFPLILFYPFLFFAIAIFFYFPFCSLFAVNYVYDSNRNYTKSGWRKRQKKNKPNKNYRKKKTNAYTQTHTKTTNSNAVIKRHVASFYDEFEQSSRHEYRNSPTFRAHYLSDMAHKKCICSEILKLYPKTGIEQTNRRTDEQIERKTALVFYLYDNFHFTYI